MTRIQMNSLTGSVQFAAGTGARSCVVRSRAIDFRTDHPLHPQPHRPSGHRHMSAESWSEPRLLRMIEDKTRESAKLDYKRAAALGKQDRLKIEISKDVSSFANAGGGTIIYGIAEDEAHEAERVDGVDPKEISKEWLDDIISSRIQRRIDGVKIHVVDLSGDHAGRVAYVVEVPQSKPFFVERGSGMRLPCPGDW